MYAAHLRRRALASTRAVAKPLTLPLHATRCSSDTTHTHTTSHTPDVNTTRRKPLHRQLTQSLHFILHKLHKAPQSILLAATRSRILPRGKALDAKDQFQIHSHFGFVSLNIRDVPFPGASLIGMLASLRLPMLESEGKHAVQ